jgi:excisionase family DNA binding protein
MALEQYSDILTIEELCEVLGIGTNAAYQLLNEHTIPAFRIGRRWKIPKEAVIQYISCWKH